MTADITRRRLLGAASLAPLAATLPASSSAAAGPTSIERLWQDRCAAFRAFDADPAVPDDHNRTSDYWDRLDGAEVAILASPETSTRAAEIRLWVAWSYYDEANRPEVWLGDAQALLKIRNDLGWNEKLLFAAILNLRGEG